MSALALKAVATLVTLVTAAAAAFYVTAHVRNPAAPLHPAVLAPGGALFSAPGGRLQLTPQVRASSVQPVSSTYAS